jgi:hypothetical protein
MGLQLVEVVCPTNALGMICQLSIDLQLNDL